MKTRIITALILIPAIIGIVYYLPPQFFNYFILLIAFLAYSEYLAMFGERKHPLFVLAALLMLMMTDAVTKMGAIVAFPDTGNANVGQMIEAVKQINTMRFPLIQFGTALFSGAVLIPMVSLVGKDPIGKKFRRLLVYTFGFFYFGLPFGLFSLIRHYGTNYHWLMFALAIPWFCDSAAYFGGKALGKHKFSPGISPNKTWEGTISGVIFSVVGGLIFGLTLLKEESLPFVMTVALFIGIFGQFGDLIESLIKRGAGVKDSGSLFPGHGGLLDRTDSLIVSATVVFVSFLIKCYV